ncbi:hypothetical protein BC629DRAFT_186096 [Irpex lacteus]|nr:hypothetical protein BC629DRAFT_186096 [Irpex lacteus]
MPSTWPRLPHQGVAQRRADEFTPSPSFDSPVPTLSHFDAPLNGTSTSSQPTPSSSTDSQHSSSVTGTSSSSPLTSATTISPVQSSPSISSSSGTTTESSSSQQSSSSSSSSQPIPSSSSHTSSSSPLRTSSSVHLSQNFFKTSSFQSSSSPTTLLAVPTLTDTVVTDVPSIINPAASPSSISGSLQSGMNQNATSSSSSSHKNVIIGVASAIGGLAVLCAILLVLFRLVSRYRKAKAEKSRRELWRYSADSWIGTRMGESRAPTPAAAGILGTYRSTDGHPLGLGAPPTAEMQQTQTAMVANYLGRYIEPAVQVPAPSHPHDRDSTGSYPAATPPGSTTGLIFSGVESELAYADHAYTSPAVPAIPVIRVTDHGAEHSRPPTNFSDLDYDTPRHSPRDAQVKPTGSNSTTRSRSNTTTQNVENPFIHPSERSALQVDTLQPENTFRSHRESAKSIKSPSGYFRMSDPFGASMVERRAPGSTVPSTSPPGEGNSVISMEGDIVDPGSTPRAVRPSRI